jgi:hypothetical protein
MITGGIDAIDKVGKASIKTTAVSRIACGKALELTPARSRGCDPAAECNYIIPDIIDASSSTLELLNVGATLRDLTTGLRCFSICISLLTSGLYLDPNFRVTDLGLVRVSD